MYKKGTKTRVDEKAPLGKRMNCNNMNTEKPMSPILKDGEGKSVSSEWRKSEIFQRKLMLNTKS